MPALPRRAFLVGGVGTAAVAAVGIGGLLVEDGTLPGRVAAYRILGLDGPNEPIPTTAPGRRYDGSFTSAARGGVRTAWSLTVPPGVEPAGLPLVVSLHGARADHETAFRSLGIDRFLARSVAAGTAPFAIATVDGGDTGYWHPRADGTDTAAMVTDELVPLLRERFGLSTRLGLYGWSMGGYGVLRLAMRSAPVQAVAACSPALFASYGATAEGAFDDRADFAREGLLGRGSDFPDVPVRIDCGKGDPFYFSVRDFVSAMPHRPAGGFEAGGHTSGYMRRMLPAHLAFLGERLSNRS